MIKKNVAYGEVSEATVMEFGTGDILVANGVFEETREVAVVLFKNDTPHSIGEESSEFTHKTSDDFKPDVVMFFTNVESIDVVIERLQKAKEHLQEEEDTEVLATNKKERKYSFFTDAFYENSFTALTAIVELNNAGLLSKDVYADGSILGIDAKDCDQSKEILKPVISDLDAYWKENNECFNNSKVKIGLNLLHDTHRDYFPSYDEIKWDKHEELFDFAGAISPDRY